MKKFIQKLGQKQYKNMKKNIAKSVFRETFPGVGKNSCYSQLLFYDKLLMTMGKIGP